MIVERTAKPFKHYILTKERNRLTYESGVVLFRAGQNLKHLHHARIAIKGKAYAGVNSLTTMVADIRPLFFKLRKIIVLWPILAASASQRQCQLAKLSGYSPVHFSKDDACCINDVSRGSLSYY